MWYVPQAALPFVKSPIISEVPRSTSRYVRYLIRNGSLGKRINPIKSGKIRHTVRIPRPSCANSRIPPRHGRPPSPSFATLFLTSPPDQCTPAGAVDSGVRGSKSTAHCTFARFHSARGRKARRPYLTSRRWCTSFNQRDDTRRRVASRCTQTQKNTSHDIHHESRSLALSHRRDITTTLQSTTNLSSALLDLARSSVYWPKASQLDAPRDRLVYARFKDLILEEV